MDPNAFIFNLIKNKKYLLNSEGRKNIRFSTDHGPNFGGEHDSLKLVIQKDGNCNCTTSFTNKRLVTKEIEVYHNKI